MILRVFLKHEILNLLKSRRIYLTVLLFLFLFISVFTVRVIDYQRQINHYILDVRTAEEELQDVKNYSHINPRAIHQPLIFSIYNQGFRFSRVIDIRGYNPIRQSIALNEERNRLFTENSRIDITFLITFFLSLFILLISYDSVNGEKQTGTLRILLSFPIKRQSFVLKKILGVFIFVSIAFTIPYLISLFCLMMIYANLLTGFFFLSAFFYWFLVILFIFFFCLLGIFISVCTTQPNRSLVYSIVIWIMLSIILPVSWDYIFTPKLFDKKITTARNISDGKMNQTVLIYRNSESEINFWVFIRSNRVWGFVNHGFIGNKDDYDVLYRFQRFGYDEYLPVAREAEQASDDVIRLRIHHENIKSMVFFFNPIVLFNDISDKIAGNSRGDYLRFIQGARAVRDDLVNVGIREGWLFDYRFFAIAADEDLLGSKEDDEQRDWNQTMDMVNNAEPFSFDMPIYRRYDQPNPTFDELFLRIAQVLALFVVCIMVMWILTWWKFMRYDVR